MVLRLPDGTFDPPIPPHPTFTAPGYQKAALFTLISALLQPKDFELLRKVQARWDDANYTRLKWAPLYVAGVLGRIRRHELDLRNELATLSEIQETF